VQSLYVAKATATGAGRQGHVGTADGVLAHDLSVPTELGGAGGAGTNPEQLFAAGYAACFASALELVARRGKVDLADAAVTAEVGIGSNGSGGFELAVTLRVELPDDVPAEQGRELLEAAHQVCPYSNATRGNIPVDLVVE
jgi:lipoyl-dependent peroxiredoxin